jgi:hypothetical protein
MFERSKMKSNNNSHTRMLIEEAFRKVQEFNYKKYIEELNIPVPQYIRVKKHPANQILEKFGFHIIRKSLLDNLESNLYSKMGKWSSVGTFQLALENPQKFDEVYNARAHTVWSPLKYIRKFHTKRSLFEDIRT